MLWRNGLNRAEEPVPIAPACDFPAKIPCGFLKKSWNVSRISMFLPCQGQCSSANPCNSAHGTASWESMTETGLFLRDFVKTAGTAYIFVRGNACCSCRFYADFSSEQPGRKRQLCPPGLFVPRRRLDKALRHTPRGGDHPVPDLILTVRKCSPQRGLRHRRPRRI